LRFERVQKDETNLILSNKLFVNFKSIIILTLLSILLACSEETSNEFKAIDHFIDDRLYEHFETFKVEAEKRNIEVDFISMNVEGHIGNIEDTGVVGQCQTFVNGSKAVVIEESYWNRASDLKKEFLVFHELGHCILNRNHLDESSANGSCSSIMNSGSASCNFSYNEKTREALLEELFANL